MIEYNVQPISSHYNFIITGVFLHRETKGISYDVCNYKKLEGLWENLEGVSNCLILVENGMTVEKKLTI